MQKCAAADPEFGLELEHPTLHGYSQTRECAADSISSKEKVTDKDRAVRKVHVSVVRKEPRFHEEAQEWWLPQVETELQVAINAAVMAISVAEIPQVGSPEGEPETTLLEFIPVYEDLDGADNNQTDESVSLSSDWALTPRTQYAEAVEEQWEEYQNQMLEVDPLMDVVPVSAALETQDRMD